MAGEGDDPLGPQRLGGQDGAQAHRAVADHGDRLAGAGLGGHGREPAGAQHVGGGEVVGQAVGVLRLAAGDDDERAVGQLDAGVLGLHARVRARVGAAGGVTRPADLAGVVRDHEGADDEVADLHVLHVVAGLDDGAHVLVAHAPVLHGLQAAVGPQVGAADAGGLDLEDDVGRVHDAGHFDVLDDDVAGGAHDDGAHGGGQGGCGTHGVLRYWHPVVLGRRRPHPTVRPAGVPGTPRTTRAACRSGRLGGSSARSRSGSGTGARPRGFLAVEPRRPGRFSRFGRPGLAPGAPRRSGRRGSCAPAAR